MVSSWRGKLEVRRQRTSGIAWATAGEATAPAAAARPTPLRKPRRFRSGVVVLGVVIGRLPDFLVWLLLIRSETCVQRHERVMKLASLRHGRDGRLVVVSRDLTRATDAFIVAPTLQAALDDWERHGPRLADLARELEIGSVPSFRFHEHDCASPLPRSYQWADGSAYVNHVELVRRARGAEMPASFWTDPLMYQGGSDSFLAPRDPIQVTDEAHGIDFEAEVAVITDDVRMGATREDAARAIRLIVLVNDASMRNLIPAELAKGFGFFHAKPSSTLSPVAVTPDELGDAWDGGKLHLPLLSSLNGKPFGKPDAGVDMTFDFP